MTWKNHHKLSQICNDHGFQNDFSNLMALKIFYERSIIQNDYKIPDDFENAVVLTSVGNELLTKIQTTFEDISNAEIKYALFLKFFHNDILIDVKNTDQLIIRNILNSEILNRNIRHLWNYETILYDRFFETFEIETEKLTYEQTIQLIEGTPQGVFQIRDLVVGPFGVLTSSYFRFLPPVLIVPLWHCSDLSCDALHPTSFSSGNILANQVRDFISNQLNEIEDIESEWNDFFSDFAGRPDHYDDMHLANFPWILINGFSEKEVRNILSRLIEQYSKQIRELFPSDKRYNNIFSGTGNHISMNLNKPQVIQLILLMPDETIIECIESLIEEEIIKIPPTEIRTSLISSKISRGAFNPTCEISRLGFRSHPIKKNYSILRLKRHIKSLYIEKNELSDLEYKLRFVQGKRLNDKLDNYLHKEDPKTIMQDIILTSPSNLEKTFKLMRYGKFHVPSSKEEENQLIDKILWKFGFDISLYPSQHSLFWDRLEKFLDTARNYPIHDESNREIIRSAGVNFFVSLEEILNLTLTFMTWSLLSDHYGKTKFKFNFSEAQNFMASCLNGKSIGSNPPIIFDMSGKNTLYPLIQGFTLLAELCKESMKNATDRLRPKHELPGFYKKTDIQLFPFIHTELLLDLCEHDCDLIIEFLQEITIELEKVQIGKIRNQIDHKRDDFPNKEEIEYALGSVKSIIRKAEKLGVIPLIYVNVGSKSDQYKRAVIEFKNYDGASINIIQPSQYSASKIPSLSKLLIIVPCMHIGDSIELMRFYFQESSDFTEMWKNYPKKRIQVTSEEIKQTE